MANETDTARSSLPEEPSRPKLLLAAVLPYLLSARLALALSESGFDVEVICPPGHPLGALKSPFRRHALGVMGANSFGLWGARARIAKAIRRFSPDWVIPCDHQAGAILHGMRGGRFNRDVTAIIEASLGPATSAGLLESRSAQVALASELGIRVPQSIAIADEASARHALSEATYPLFLKGDGSWAGQGVNRADCEDEALAAWRQLASAHTLATAISRVRTHGWRFALSCVRRVRPAIDIQQAVQGRPANHALVCRDGVVLAGLTVVAVETTSSVGPASVVEVIENHEISSAAATLVDHLKLSGLIGFDFMLDAHGQAHFLEINARATPIMALSIAGSADLPAALLAAMRTEVRSQRPVIAGTVIALFPNEIGRDRHSPWLRVAHHDVPSGEPGLVAYGLRSVGLAA